jgi:tetratricopeptide (TPR) repeat protein
MTWKKWAIDNPKNLAQYVLPEERLNLGIDELDLCEKKQYLDIVRAIYEAFRAKSLWYDIPEYNPDEGTQIIREPNAILEGVQKGTCLDLALLFAGECIKRHLLPLVVSVYGHAFVAVAVNTGLDTKPRDTFQGGIIKDLGTFRRLVENGSYIPVECTGFVKSQASSVQVEGVSRDGEGFLTFEDAMKVGRMQFDAKPFLFAIDADFLHRKGYPPHAPESEEFQVAQETQKDVREIKTLIENYRTNPTDARVNAPPAARNTLFGRDDALERTERALREGKTALVHGMGGVGKTAVALETAKRLHAAKAFPDGIVWVSEIGSAPTTAICDAVARSLGNDDIPKLSADDPGQRQQKLEGTRQLLSTRNLALILDDVASPDMAHEFLDTCLPTGMGALLTSRRADIDAQEYMALDVLAREDAKELFLERCKKEAEDAVLDGVCDVLEDHPLALVIAAGRVRAEGMTVPRLLERLQDEKERLPTVAPDDITDKDRNVRVSMQVSFDDLNDEQKRVFTNLAACFAETTGPEFLSIVCDLSPTECEDRLGELVNRSLIIVDRNDQRYGLHPLVQDFARDLATNSDVLQVKVIDSALVFAKEHSKITPKDLSCLEKELLTLLNSIEYSISINSIANAFGIADNILKFLGLRGYWTERLKVCNQVIDLAVKNRRYMEEFDYKITKARYLCDYGDYSKAEEIAEDVREIQNPSDNSKHLLRCEFLFATIYISSDEHQKAKGYLKKALIYAKRSSNNEMTGKVIGSLAIVAERQKRIESSKTLYEKAIEIFIQIDDKDSLATAYHQLGILYQNLRDYQKAIKYYNNSLTIAIELDDKLNIANTLHQIGYIAEIHEFDFKKAKSNYERSSEIHEALKAANARISKSSLQRIIEKLQNQN